MQHQGVSMQRICLNVKVTSRQRQFVVKHGPVLSMVASCNYSSGATLLRFAWAFPLDSMCWREAWPMAWKLHSKGMTHGNPTTPKPERKVLLAVREGHVEARLLASARGLAQRMGADVDILVLAAGETLPAEVEDFVRTLRDEGIAYTLTVKPDLRRRDIVQYANNHECVATVVIDSLEGWESVAADRASNPWIKLACPLVTAAPAKTPNR